MALAMVGVLSFVLALLVLPVAMLPALIEESRWDQYARGYIEYLGALSTFGVRPSDAVIVFGAAFLWSATCVAFLSPIVGPPRPGWRGRSLVPSVVTAATIGSLACALVWVSLIETVCAFVCSNESELGAAYQEIRTPLYVTGLVIWIGCGLAWYLLLRRSGEVRDPQGIDLLMRRLFAGTCVELLLGVAFYLQVRRRTDCYCSMASFWNLVFGVATLLWMCGPWAVLLVTRKERSQWGRGACRRCGYPRRTDATVCPECGEHV